MDYKRKMVIAQKGKGVSRILLGAALSCLIGLPFVLAPCLQFKKFPLLITPHRSIIGWLSLAAAVIALFAIEAIFFWLEGRIVHTEAEDQGLWFKEFIGRRPKPGGGLAEYTQNEVDRILAAYADDYQDACRVERKWLKNDDKLGAPSYRASARDLVKNRRRHFFRMRAMVRRRGYKVKRLRDYLAMAAETVHQKAARARAV